MLHPCSLFSLTIARYEWQIQAWLSNGPGIARLLPSNAPLSTLRLVTASRASAKPTDVPCAPSDVLLLSACFRAGTSQIEP
jgi:hypothetical protein